MASITEDDRVHISELMYDLLTSRKENTRNSFIEVCYSGISSVCKQFMYVAGKVYNNFCFRIGCLAPK